VAEEVSPGIGQNEERHALLPGRGHFQDARLPRLPRVPRFAAAWESALESSIDVLEAEARRRALTDDRDALLMFLLRGLRARVYGDKRKLEHSGGSDPIRVEQSGTLQVRHSLTAQDVARVPAGAQRDPHFWGCRVHKPNGDADAPKTTRTRRSAGRCHPPPSSGESAQRPLNGR